MRRLAGIALAAVGLLMSAGVAPVQAAVAAHFTSGVAVPRPSCAATASCTYTVLHPAKKTVTNGPANADSADIDYDIYKPDAATAAAPQPAIMYFNGFGGAKDDSSGVALGKFFASHGYVYLAFSSEGFGQSTGHIELDSPEFDVKNAKALIDELGNLAYVFKDAAGDPRVGLTGGSYGGAIQLMTAEFDPRVDAITPFRTWNSLEYSLAPNNLRSNYQPQSQPCCGVFKFEWSSLFFAAGAATPFQGNGSGVPGTFFNPAPQACPGFDARLCPIYLQTAATGLADPTARSVIDNSSPASYFSGGTSFDPNQHSSGLNVPTLLGQGELDTLFNLNDAIANYNAVLARGVPVKMLWHSNGHGYPDQPGEDDVFGGDASNPNQNYIPKRLLSWFDRYLRFDVTVDTGPTFAYFRDWVPYDTKGSAEPAYGTASTFPFESDLTFSLSGSSDLLLPGQAPVAGSATVTSPPKSQPASYTETSNFQCSTCNLPGGAPSPFTSIQPSNPPGEFADFTSAPFTRDVVSVGVPTAHLHISQQLPTGSQDIVFYGKVYDVAPDGTAELIKRLIAPVRVFDASKAVDIQLLGIAHRFAAGHSVRLEIASTDLTSETRNPLADVYTLTTGGVDAATFSLPVDGAPATAIVPTQPAAAAPSTLPSTSTGTPLRELAGLIALLAGALALPWLSVYPRLLRTRARSASKNSIEP